MAADSGGLFEDVSPRVAVRLRWLEDRLKFWRTTALWALVAIPVLLVVGYQTHRTYARGSSEKAVELIDAMAKHGYALGYSDAVQRKPASFDNVRERVVEQVKRMAASKSPSSGEGK